MTTARSSETAPATRGAAGPRTRTAPPGHRLVRSLASTTARLASWPVWLSHAIVFGVFARLLFASSAPFAIPHVETACGQRPPDVRVFTSAADVTGFLSACGAAGRDAYRFLQLADLLYPMVFGLFMTASSALVLSRLATRRHSLLALAALPLLGSAFDYVENLCAWLALAAFPGQPPTSHLLGLASTAKNVTFWASGAVLLCAIAVLAARKAKAIHATA
ncbi:hypothetical protein [Terrabacter sp. 2RAF25]|uniref:hypothetical protein n=1 Tax=Terrabacter sp. 2RAF25 TaxID=3232998 RepID=UPI003F99F6EF